MKRWLSGLLAALTLFSLSACGGVVDLTEVPEEGARVEDVKADLPPAEDPEEDGEVPPPEEESGPYTLAVRVGEAQTTR